MKKRLIAGLLAVAMVLSLAACGSSEKPAAEEKKEETAAETTTEAEGGLTGTLKLGFIGPLTGAAAIYGTNAANGAGIAANEINALGGAFQIEYMPEDDEHDAEKSVNAYNTLKDKGMQAMVGCVTTTPCIAVSTEANADRVFMLTPSASAASVPEGKDNMFQLCFSDPNQGSASAKYINDNKLGEKIAVIYNNADAYSTGIYQTFTAAAEELGMNVVSVTTFTDDTNDFSVQLADAKNNEADIIFLPIYYTPASLIMQQAAAMSYSPVMFGVDGMDGILSIEGFDTSLAEGVMLLTPFAADAKDDATVSFVTKFQDAYKDTPSQFAADGYDCVYAIYYALQYYAEKNGGLNVDALSTEEICELLISVFSADDFSVDGLTGAGMTWTADGFVNKDPKAVVIKDGVYVGL